MNYQNTSTSTNELTNLPSNDCTDDNQEPELVPKQREKKKVFGFLFL